MFEGIYVALVTPFTEDGRIDFGGLARLVDQVIERGVHGLVPCGTTGESPTLDYEEHTAVVAAVVKAARHRVPVIAGTGSNSTAEAIRLSREAQEVGADGLLLVLPYYNKPTPEGLYQHFAAIADAVELPQMLYNIPGRTAVGLDPDTLGRLAGHPRIVAIKEASGSLTTLAEMMRRTPSTFRFLAGDDAMLLPFLAYGAHGVVSVLAQLAPEPLVAMWNAWRSGRPHEAAALHHKWFPLMQTLFAETNPAPIKEALYLTGLIERADLRLPLVRVRPATVARLREALSAQGIKLERGW